MKKSIILLSSALLGAMSVWANPVDRQTATEVAIKYLSKQSDAPSSLKVKDVQTIGNDLYLINFSPVGYVIVAGDDTTNPIIGYSTESGLDIDRMPENMAYMIDGAAEAVRINKKNIKTPNNRWNAIKNGYVTVSRAEYIEPVRPLISVNWDQTGRYNTECPGEGSNKAMVGCVAVAMSQAMSVQRYPVKPSGRVSYTLPGYGNISVNYDDEPAYDWNAILSGSDGYKEVARLLYHAGVSVQMEYGKDSSGIPTSQPDRISTALTNIFGYGSDIRIYHRSQTSNWEQLLQNELYAGRAVVYNGVDTKGGYGHSFNIDGISDSGLYHVNWGWGGYGNGYMSLDNLGDSRMNMHYNDGHIMVTGIGSQNAVFRSIELSQNYIETGKGEGNVLGMLLVNGEKVADDVKVELTGRYQSSSASYADVPFTYAGGLIKSTRAITKDEGPIYLRVEVSTSDGAYRLSQTFNITVEDPKPIANRTSVNYDRATSTFTITSRYGAEIVLRDAAGVEIPLTKDEILPVFKVSRTALSDGMNTLEMKFEGETKSIKIKK